MTPIGGEKGAVQNPIIKYAAEIGWEYVNPDDSISLRGGETGFLFRDLFISQIQSLNPEFMNPSLTGDLIKRLATIQPNIEGNLIAWEHIKGIRSIFVPDKKRERNVRFIDSENIGRNTFHVTDEFSYTNGSKTIRPDIVFLVNGVPVFFIETKAAHKIEGISEALDQVRKYHLHCPELLSIFQVYSLTHLIKYYYSATWNTSGKLLYNWREEVEGDFEKLVKSFLDKERVIRLLTDFILFTRQDDELKKVIFRPHQMRAVNRLIERAKDPEKKRGLIWHTQGSGKTYTMIVTAQKILKDPTLQNPTVIMLVDRNELESQLFGNLAALGIENVEVAESKKHLQNLLVSDRKGLIVTMIHKFEDMPEKANTKKDIFVLVDEAHRTTGGKLGNYLVGALPNATYIGFTGTPIDKTLYGKGTFITFGYDDPPKGYLDKYSIAESIEDGTTVPLHYTLAPNKLRVDKETLEKEFLLLKEAEGMSDIEELNKVLEKAVTLKNMLKNKERMESVAEFVATHYKENIEPLGYKAFLVGVDREACALYKQKLDKHLPPEYSRVVYSPFYNDLPNLARYHLSEEEEKRVRKAFRKPDELPKILIVTEKLLTGFDAPILYCMYLDKPMRDHVLLQAIARVNRPYEDVEGRKKPSGFVLDFVGIFENLEKALAFDSQDISGVINDIELLKTRFKQLMDEADKTYLVIISGKTQDKAVEAVLEYFRDEETRHTYYQFYRETSDIYDIISPDAFLYPYIEKMEILARIQRIIKEAYEPGVPIDRDFSRKTARLVQKHTKTDKIKSTLEVYEINGDTLRKIEESKTTDTEKVFNLLKGIRKVIVDNIQFSPYLISIGDKAELIAELFEKRQRTTIETLEELKKIIEEINTARREQKEKNMSAEVYSIFWMLRNQKIDKAEDKANQLREILQKYPYWNISEAHEREVKKKLTGVLLRSGMTDITKVTEISQNIMRVIKGRME
jgi:type I restriction enzyme R subunit